MSKFCGNCGAQMDDSARVCGNCGTPFEMPTVSNARIPGVTYVDPEVKARKTAKIKKTLRITVIIAVLVAVAILAVNIVSAFTGYKGTVRKIMNAFKEYDLNTIVSLSSSYYDAREDESDVYDNFGDIISNALDSFEERVGHKYKFSYEITYSYKMSEHKFQDLINTLSYYDEFAAENISEAMVVQVDAIAKEGNTRYIRKLKLTLTKEEGTWKLLYLDWFA